MQSALNILLGASMLSDNVAQIGKGVCAGKGLVIKQDWCWRIYVQGHDLRFFLADLQSNELTKLAETVRLLSHVLMRVRSALGSEENSNISRFSSVSVR